MKCYFAGFDVLCTFCRIFLVLTYFADFADLVFNAKSQRCKGKKKGIKELCVFAPWRLCVNPSLLTYLRFTSISGEFFPSLVAKIAVPSTL